MIALGSAPISLVHASWRLGAGEMDQVAWANGLDFVRLQWMRFEQSPAGPAQAIGNPMRNRSPPRRANATCASQPSAPITGTRSTPATERRRAVWRRAIDVAAHIGVRTVTALRAA